MNLIFLYFSFVFILMQKEYVVCSTTHHTTTSGLSSTPLYYSSNTESSGAMNEKLSVKDWINASIPNHSREIMRKFGNMLTKEYNNREKISISTIEGMPRFITNTNNHSVVFNSLRLNYDISYYEYSDFNEFKCAEYLQVNISKFVRTLSITGYVAVDAMEPVLENPITISLERTLISNIRNIQVINNQIMRINDTSSVTNVQYAKMKTDIDANEKNTPFILSAIPTLLEELKAHFHRKIDKSVLEKLSEDLPIPDDFQCSTNGIGTYSTLLNKMYIIEEKENDVASTHKLMIGPVVINGFSNISVITWEYAWSPDDKSYRQIVMNVGPLSAKADWDITSSRRNYQTSIESYTDKFIIKNAKLISKLSPEKIYSSTTESYYSYDRYHTTTEKPYYEHRYSFEAEVETSVSRRASSVIDNVLCANLEKLISKSFVNSLTIYKNNQKWDG